MTGFEIIALVVSLATAAYSMVMAKRMNVPDQERGGLAVNRFGIDKPIPVIYGTRQVPPVIVYQGVKDVSGDPDNEIYYAILIWTVGPITSLSDLTFDDLPYSQFGVFDGTGDQRLEHCYGSDDQTMPAWFRNEAPDDMSDMHFRGLAVTYLKLRMDDEYKRYPQGRPEFKATITARSSNPVEALYDYLFNSDYGCGWDVDWDAEHNELMRSYCNNVYDGQPLMTCNMVIDTEKKLQENVEDILQTCRGYLIEGQFGLKLEIDRAKDPVMHVSEDMLTGGMSSASVNINQRYNSVTIRFPNKDLKWKTDEVTFPEKNSALHLQWLDEDNGVDLTKEETVSGIDTFEHAMQYAEVLARASRDSTTLNLSVQSFVGWQVEEMDVVTVASQSRGWTAKPFSVREISYKEKETKLKLVEYQDSHYLWHQKPPKPDYPDTELPNPNKVAPPSDLSFLVSDLPGVSGVLAWNSAGGYTDGYDVIVVADGEEIWRQRTRTKYVAIPVFLSGHYELAVRTVGAIAVSGWSVLSIDMVAPDAPFEVQVDAGNTYLILRPKSTTLAFGTEYEFWFNDELRGTGVAWQLEGLQPETEYTFQVRAVNAVGQSEFVQVSAATTSDASVMLDILAGNLTREILDDNLNAYFDSLDESIDALDRAIKANEITLTDMIGDVETSVVELKDVTEVNRVTATQAIQDATGQLTGMIGDVDRSVVELQEVTEVNRTVAAQALQDATGQLTDMIGAVDRSVAELQEVTEVNRVAATEAVQVVSGDVDGVKLDLQRKDMQLQALTRSSEDGARSAFAAAVQMHAFMQEHERRLLEGETLTDAVVYRDPETGLIINRAYQYTDTRYSAASLRIDGVAAQILLATQDISRVETETDERLVSAEAAIAINASAITQKASYSEVSEAISGAMAAITPAYSWQFNTTEEGWPNVIWNVGGTITGTVFSRDDLSFDGDENSALRLRLKSDTGGTLSWNGGNQNVAIPAPGVSGEFETIIVSLSEADGWTGTITSIRLVMDAEIASIEIGKPSASELQLQDLSYRVTQAEQELDAENARWSVYITQDFWNKNALQQSDVRAQIDAWNSTYGVTATLQTLSDNGTVDKANSAQSWIDGADAHITDLVVAYNGKSGGTDEQLAKQAEQLQAAQQKIDAIDAEIDQTVVSITNVDNATGDRDRGYQAMLDSFNDFLRTGEFETEKVSLSYAQQKINAHSTELASQAQSLLQLFASRDAQQASIVRLDKATADNEQAIAESNETLSAQIDDESQARINAVSQVLSDLNQSMATIQSNLESQLDEESQARINAVSQVLSDLNQSMATIQSNLESQLDEESQARINAVSQVLSDLNQSMATLQSNLESQLDEESQARISAVSQVLSDLNQSMATLQSNLESQLGEESQARINAVSQVLSDLNQSMATLQSNLESQLDEESQARINAVSQVLSDLNQSMATLQSTLESQLGEESQARINAVSQVLSDLNQSMATLQSNLESQLDEESQARINAVSQVLSDLNQSMATLQSNLESQLDEESQARINAVSQVLSDLNQSMATIQSNLESQLDEETQARVQAISKVVSDTEQARADSEQMLVSQIANVENQLPTDKGRDALLAAFDSHRQEEKISGQDVSLSYANQRLTTLTTSLASQAQSLQELFAARNAQQAQLTRLDKVTADNEQAIAESNETLSAQIDEESQARINAVSQVLSDLNQSMATLQSNLESQLGEESQARINAVSQVLSDLNQSMATIQSNLESQLDDESQARINAVSQVLSDLNQSMATLQSNLESQLDDESQARINAVSQVLSDLNQSMAIIQSNLESQLDEESQARINAVSQVLSDLNQSMATLQSNLESQLDEESQARINAVSQVLSDLNQSMATIQSNLESQLDEETQARVQAISKVASDTEQARADSEQMLVSQIANVENQLPTDKGRDALLAAFDSHRQEEKISGQDVSLSYANQRLTTLTTSLASQAQSLSELFAARNAQQARLTRLDKVTADNEQAIAESNETLSAQIDEESQARINAVSQVLSDLNQSMATIQSNLESQLDEESQARINAVSQVLSDLNQSMATIQSNLESQLDEESQARINAVSQVLSDLNQSMATLQSNLESQLDEESQARINAVSQVLSDLNQSMATLQSNLESQLGEESQARINAVSQVLSDLYQSMATLQSTLESQLDEESQARINAVSQVLSDLNQSMATLQSTLESQLDEESQARINAVSQVLSDLNQSMATLQSTLESQLDEESQARINAVSQVLSDLNQSMATLQSNLESQLNDETQARVQAISKVVSDTEQARADSEQMLVSQIANVENQLPTDKGRDALLAAFDSHRQEEKISDQDISLSYANQRLTTLTTSLASQAQSLLELYAARNAQQAQLTRLDKVTADNEQAIAESNETLSAQIEDESQARISAVSQVLSDLNQSMATIQSNLESQLDDESQARINAVSQVLSDLNQSMATIQNNLESQMDDESQARINAVSQVVSDLNQSMATLQSMMESQLDDESQARINAVSQVVSDLNQSMATLQSMMESQLDDESQARINAISQVVSDSAQALASATQQLTARLDNQQAQVSYHAEAFVDDDGKAVAKGGLTTDVNGRVSGMVNTNDGEQSALDIIADYLRVGVMQEDNFVPLMQLDAELRELILRGRLLLGDGVELKNAASIQAQVGAGSYTLTLRNGAFPDDATASSDFVSTYGRQPEKDAHLTYRNAAGTASSMKRWTGSAWSTPTMIVHGDQITTGTVTGDRFVAGTEILTPVLTGGTGDFSGLVTAKDGSFIDKVEIGSAGGYRVFIRSVANAGYNVIEVVNSSGNVVFAVQGNGNLYSVGGGYLDNLTIGSNVDVMGRVRANQIIGDVVSAESVTINKSDHETATWKSVGTISGINNTGHLASVVLNPISIYTQYGLSPNRDELMRGYGTYYCRVLYNGSEVARTSSRLWSETGGGSSIRYASFMSPTYCRKIEVDEEFTLTLQIYCEMQNFGVGEGTTIMHAECDTVAQVFRSGSAFYN